MERQISTGWMQSWDDQRLFGLHPVVAAVLVQVFVWSVGPTLLFGNLHTDSLEAAFWARDWALGYSKHPPLTSWIMDAALRTGLQPILALNILSQITVAITAFFVWRIGRLYASAETAALAVMLYLASPSATIYAVQINHNSMLAPFWSGTAYFGLLYLEERRWRDAIALGVIAGLGMLTKYEILFVLATLLVLGLCVPRFRPAFYHPASYIAALIFLVVISPHIWWLNANHWPSVSRALGAVKLNGIETLNASAVNSLVGMFTLFVAPAAILLGTIHRRAADAQAQTNSSKIEASILGFVPLAVLFLGAIATMQVIKPLWVLPLASTIAISLAVLFPAGQATAGLQVGLSGRIAAALSCAIFAGFALYLIIAGALGKPLTAFSADTKKLASATTALWREHSQAPLECIVIDERKIGPSGVLWLPGRPGFVDLSGGVSRESPRYNACRRSGAIAVLLGDDNLNEFFPSVCNDTRQRFDMPASFAMGGAKFPVNLVYIAPDSNTNCGKK